MAAFKVWQDDEENEAFVVIADGMPEALDAAAAQLGCIDYSDLAQEKGWSGDEGLNIIEVEEGRNALAADTVNGVYVCESPPDEDVLQDEDFYNALATQGDGTIYGDVSDTWAQKIAADYGIH
jgi:hypothetical protein